MDTVAASLGSIPSLTDQETGNLILRGRLKTPKELVGTYQALFSADYESTRARALQQALIDGAPPYSDARDTVLGLKGRTNVNWGHAAAAQEESEQPYHDVFESLDTFGPTPTKYGSDENQKSYYSAVISEELTEMVRNNDDFDSNKNQLIQLFTKEGLGFVFFQDDMTWHWEVRGQQYFKFPRRVKANVNSLDMVTCRMEMMPHEVYGKVEDEEVAEATGWNRAACIAAVKAATERGLDTDNPQSWQQDIKDQNIFSSMTAKTVSVVHGFVREVDGSVSHYICRYDAEGEFLYKSIGKWKSMCRCLVAFSNAVGSNGDFHSVRGNGQRIFQSASALNRMLCKTMDYFIHETTPYLTYQNEDAITNSAFHPVGPYVAISNDLQFVQNPMPNTAQGLMPPLQMIENIFSARARVSAPSTSGQSSRTEKTKYQVEVETEQSSRMSTASFNLFFAGWRRFWRETVRRASREDYHPKESGGEEVWRMRRRLIERGVPLQALYDLDLDAVDVNTGIGKGSLAERRTQVDALMERLYPQLDPSGQQTLLRLVGAAYGGIRLARELVPEQMGMRPPVDAQIAKMENSVMSLGQPAAFEPNQNHAVHIENHLIHIDQVNTALAQGQMELAEAIPAMEPVWNHAQNEHLPMLDPMSSQTAQFREQLQQFGEVIVNGSKHLAKEQERAAEGQPVDGETPLGLTRQAADAEARFVDSVQAQAKAASLQLDLAAKQQAMRAKDAEAKQKLAINDALAAQKIRNQSIANKQKQSKPNDKPKS